MANLGNLYIIFGDLNEMESIEEKQGGAPLTLSTPQFLPFNIDHINNPTIGNPFTWRKSKQNIDNVYEKLDRVLLHISLTYKYFSKLNNYSPFVLYLWSSLITSTLGIHLQKLILPSDLKYMDGHT